MAQVESLYSELAGNHESVLVTHVESPVLFYCRLVTDEERVAALQDNIARYVASSKPIVPDAHKLNGPSKFILVYSIIRDRWCRGRVISYQRTPDAKPINAKVCLIDYGSIEIVLWNEKYVRMSTPEIDACNDGRGFCFPCGLGNIKPYDDTKPVEMLQWGSYANFMIEKETKNRHFLLQMLNSGSQSRNIVICDLLPTTADTADNPTLSPASFTSLTSHLVHSNVARYIDRDYDEQHFPSDDEKENLFIANC